jgi:endonuclease/exonuclease/phosphatase family metal-dependent hydrolase
VLIIAIVAGVWIWGAIPEPTGSASGDGVSGILPPMPPGKTVFRVATFNMHSGVGGADNIYNIGRTADAVRNTDLCALQECRGYFFGPITSQAQLLGEKTNRAWLYAPSERRYWHDEFGNGLLTNVPVESWVRMPLPIEPAHGGRRDAVIARVDFGGHPATVLFCHIDRKKDQATQLELIRRLFQSLKPPCLLLADLNAEASNPHIQAILALPGVHDCIAEAHADEKTRNRIDWILAIGFKTVGGGRLQNGASDHPIYWADVRPEQGPYGEREVRQPTSIHIARHADHPSGAE